MRDSYITHTSHITQVLKHHQTPHSFRSFLHFCHLCSTFLSVQISSNTRNEMLVSFSCRHPQILQVVFWWSPHWTLVAEHSPSFLLPWGKASVPWLDLRISHVWVCGSSTPSSLSPSLLFCFCLGGESWGMFWSNRENILTFYKNLEGLFCSPVACTFI